MDNAFGNFAIQKIIQYGTKHIQESIFARILPNIKFLCTKMYGCRIVQMSIDVFKNDDDKLSMILKEINPLILSLFQDKHGNHVLQKCVDIIKIQKLDELVFIIIKNGKQMSYNYYASRVIKKVLYKLPKKKAAEIIDSLLTDLKSFFVSNCSN